MPAEFRTRNAQMFKKIDCTFGNHDGLLASNLFERSIKPIKPNEFSRRKSEMDSQGDALSDILRMVHLKACIYFVKDMSPPWGMDIPVAANGPLHMVLKGCCVLRCNGQEITLEEGDAILLPHGTTHQMLDSPSSIPEPGAEVMTRLMNEVDAEAAPGSTRMLCGHFEWDETFDHPFFRELPELIVLRRVLANGNADRFRSVVDLITTETNGVAPGGSAIADRLGEVLMISMLRTWLTQQQSEKGIVATLADPRLSRALQHIHKSPDKEVDLKTLAQIAGMSRTSFAVRFREVMGMPPASYLTEWRMLKARKLLLQTELSTTDIVNRVGYGSDAAFLRAFKRRFGETPGKLRRAQKAV